ncbi:cytochrome c3 family protein [Desulfoluna spongiiphila]|uniref:Class III cytochrome C family protein n=1 Tax=Desulfoluna spongiiphila TaxID=419481 RepID=A0A1G5J6G3_9BACT|nr:cytochrome c3 family protein [Desulfoluna spongiiphila]SCY83409.1 Class III cytochrome C family protein [Desulfoluna spongiiphila]VVS93001.1 class iii cytochrome c [Desulfoluna spongiiphila]
MNKTRIITLLSALVVSLAAVSLLWAGTTVEDTFDMKTKEYTEAGGHKYSPVPFTHKKHHEDYKITCGECHHDENGKALELTMGDDVQRCIECHDKLGKAPKGKGKKKLKGKEKRQYHAEAVHDNCITCHKAFNKEFKKKAKDKKAKGPAPTSCKKCHTEGKIKK